MNAQADAPGKFKRAEYSCRAASRNIAAPATADTTVTSCEYVRNYYGVPACIGRRVIVGDAPGIIAADRGHYIGVNFDCEKPGIISNVHPTDNVQYLDMGEVRKPSKYAARYQRFLEYGDCFNSFIDFCRWDAAPAREWNKGY